MTISSQELFYTAPSDEIYNELLQLAIEIWSSYDDSYWYATEKINYIKSFRNISSNFMTIYQMFDYVNQMKLIRKASEALKLEINERL